MRQMTLTKSRFGLLIGAFGVLATLALSSCSFGYNSLVESDEKVKAAWAQVENQYQRRYDLIPGLVETVKGVAAHERGTLKEVTEARSKMGGMLHIPTEALSDPKTMQKYQEAQNSLGGALQRLMMVTENYPALKANESFRDLQAQLEGTENRIAVERMRYNEAVQSHNVMVRSFPKNLIAGMFNFKPAVHFEMDKAAKEAPKVKF